MDHQSKATKVEVLADKLVKDILGGAKGPIWHASFAQLVRIMTWAFPTRYVDKLVNAERGLEYVTRR
jgi:1-acylglycerone phosphate reductase